MGQAYKRLVLFMFPIGYIFKVRHVGVKPIEGLFDLEANKDWRKIIKWSNQTNVVLPFFCDDVTKRFWKYI